MNCQKSLNTEGMTVAEIAKQIKANQLKLLMMGVMVTQKNQSLDSDTIELLMVDYG